LEKEIATMVSDGSVYAKIDRPKDIVRFSAPKNPEAVLTEWASDIDKLLHLVETTTHLINKENMTK
jgi:26S proteasome regulatory subunit N5